MGFLELLLIGVGLSMDAFAVAVCQGLCMPKLNLRYAAVIALFFGGFQALMPVAGYLLGVGFEHYISSFDHWIAFLLLGLIGANMIRESRGGEEHVDSSFRPRSMLPLAVATSIDAMAVGVSLAVMPHTGMLSGDYGYLLCCAVIAAVTFVICAVGVKIGCKTGDIFGRKAEIAGGIVLIGIGVKILIEHLMGG